MDIGTLELKVARSENLPVLPQAVSTILKQADDPGVCPRSIATTIEKDPAIAAKILRVANSSYYGLNGCASLGHAISVLGMASVKQLVLAVAYHSIASADGGSKHFDRLAFWQHSLAVGTAARILGKLKMPLRAEEIYCAGMMHEIGLLVLEKFSPDLLNTVLKAARDAQRSLLETQSIMLGFNHAELGGMLAGKWALGDTIRSGIEHHDRPHRETNEPRIAHFVAAADYVAMRAGFLNQVPGEEVYLAPEVLEDLGMPEEQLEPIISVTAAEVAKAKAAFQIPLAA